MDHFMTSSITKFNGPILLLCLAAIGSKLHSIYEKDHRLQYIIIYTAIKRIENNNTRYDGFSYYRRRYNADGYG